MFRLRETIALMNGYDMIGDIHGCAEKLEGLLRKLGYEEKGGAYRYSGSDEEREAIFVGDLIDRGSQQIRTIELVRAMVDAGSAQIVMGNHEFNAISYATPDPENPGEFMRPHSDKNRRQHRKFIEQVPPDGFEHSQYMNWFTTLPLWLELDGIRVIHACWSDDLIEQVSQWIPPGTPIPREFVVKANRKGSAEYEAIEVMLKGPEMSLGAYDQPSFVDKDKNVRAEARIRWWNQGADTLRELAEIPPGSTLPDGAEYPELPERRARDQCTSTQAKSQSSMVITGGIGNPSRARTGRRTLSASTSVPFSMDHWWRTDGTEGPAFHQRTTSAIPRTCPTNHQPAESRLCPSDSSRHCPMVELSLPQTFVVLYSTNEHSVEISRISSTSRGPAVQELLGTDQIGQTACPTDGHVQPIA